MHRESRRRPVSERFWFDARNAAAIIAACWIFYIVSRIGGDAMMIGDVFARLPGRLILSVAGALLSFVVFVLIWTLWARSIWLTLINAVIGASLAAVVFGFMNAGLRMVLGEPVEMPLMAQVVVVWTVTVHMFFAQSVAIIAYLYAMQMHRRERDALEAQRLLKLAELRALRYQIKPHFLFNALNSVSALLQSERSGEADEMVTRLADYYETAVTTATDELVPLQREIEAQSRYLDIERVRFPDRLAVDVDLPAELRDALVPAFMIQPLVENSIKHAVAVSTRPVQVRLKAQIVGDQLHIEVSDDGSGSAQVRGVRGSGTGLMNIQNRLDALFGARASLISGVADRGYVSIIKLPLMFAEACDEGVSGRRRAAGA